MDFRRLLLPFLLALAAPSALAQVPDTTAAWRYYPLAVGDVWEYRNTNAFPADTSYTRHTITGDTLIEGRRYFLRLRERYDASGVFTGTHVEEVRFDTLTATVKAWRETEERAITCPLDAPFGSEIECPDVCFPGNPVTVSGDYDQTITIGQSTVTTSVKRYDTQGCENLYKYAAGVGEWEHNEFGFVVRRLIYARIDGVEYGEPFPVGAEADPEGPHALRLAVHPNPVVGTATVALTVGRPQHAAVALYDVLGRRVALLHEGAVGAGAHAFQLDASGLPAGTYVVRAAGEGGVATVKVVLR